jgi:hypothetical protein
MMSTSDTNVIFSKSKLKKSDESDESNTTLQELVDENNFVLFEIKTVFPFTFFPNILRIDFQKVSITHKDFFWSRSDRIINISDIVGVSVQSDPLFATLVITTKFYNQDFLKISYLHKKQATLARKIIQGLIIVSKQKIKIEETDRGKIITMLEKIGKIG